jgi:hypothetical protein
MNRFSHSLACSSFAAASSYAQTAEQALDDVICGLESLGRLGLKIP